MPPRHPGQVTLQSQLEYLQARETHHLLRHSSQPWTALTFGFGGRVRLSVASKHWSQFCSWGLCHLDPGSAHMTEPARNVVTHWLIFSPNIRKTVRGSQGPQGPASILLSVLLSLECGFCPQSQWWPLYPYLHFCISEQRSKCSCSPQAEVRPTPGTDVLLQHGSHGLPYWHRVWEDEYF